jgi:hypothetical protein
VKPKKASELKLKKGDMVRVRRVGESDHAWTEALVGIISENQMAMGLILKGAVRTSGGGMILNTLPLMFDEEAKAYRGVVIDELYEVRELASA